jgi:hypothetical protein
MGSACIFMERSGPRSDWFHGKDTEHFDDDQSGTAVERARVAGDEWRGQDPDHHDFKIVVRDKA